jgi:hypothetical protein
MVQLMVQKIYNFDTRTGKVGTKLPASIISVPLARAMRCFDIAVEASSHNVYGYGANAIECTTITEMLITAFFFSV